MRIKRGTTSHHRHKRLLKTVKGYRMTRHRLVKVAREAQLHAGSYSYAGRKRRKRDFRRLWITHLSAAVKNFGLSYSQFISRLKKAKVLLDRKILSALLREDPEVFAKIVDKAKKV